MTESSEHEWLSEALDEWFLNGPFTFDAINNIAQKCAPLGWTIEDWLDDRYHLIKMPDFLKVINPRSCLKGVQLQNWTAACGYSVYKGQNFDLLDADQRIGFANWLKNSTNSKPSINFLIGKLTEPSICRLLEFARDLLSDQQVEKQAMVRRDNSPKRKAKH